MFAAHPENRVLPKDTFERERCPFCLCPGIDPRRTDTTLPSFASRMTSLTPGAFFRTGHLDSENKNHRYSIESTSG